ncbi:origin recognition complex subunit 3 N-terminus-domain-containing protein [Entophlyctis helioformis]|nr:origin recognition complex subunit 3 N-terminus-domain-containing protein [Entophlyctis helioformis]
MTTARAARAAAGATTGAAGDGGLGSVTEAMTLLLPSRKRPAAAAAAAAEAADGRPGGGFVSLDGGRESPASVALRRRLLATHATQLEAMVSDVLSQSNHAVLRQIVDFVDHATPSPFGTPYSELPTASLLTGINSTDHVQFYAQLAASLRTAGHAVAELKPADASSLKLAMRCMIQDLTAGAQRLDAEDDDDGEDGEQAVLQQDAALFPSSGKMATAPAFSIERLVGWYGHQRAQRGPGSAGKLVVLVTEFEGIDAAVLSRLIMICSERLAELPFVFVICLATSVDALHQALPRSVISLVRIEKFKLQHVHECINELGAVIQLNPDMGFKLGARPYQQLLDSFHLHNMSVSAFIRGIKYGMMAHFYGNPLSVLAQQFSNAGDDRSNVPLTESQLLSIRMLPSFREHIESIKESHPSLVRRLLTDDAALAEHVQLLMSNLRAYQSRFQAAFQIAMEIQQSFSAAALQRPVCMLIADAFYGNLMETDHFKTIGLAFKHRRFAVVKEVLEKVERASLACPKPVPLPAEVTRDGDDLEMDSHDEAAASQDKTHAKHGNSSIKHPPGSHESILELLQISAQFTASSSDGQDGQTDQDALGSLQESDEDADDAMYLMKQGLKRARLEVLRSRKTNVATRLKPLDLQAMVVPSKSPESWAIAAAHCIWEFLHEALEVYTSMPLYEAVYYSDSGKSLAKVFTAQPRAVVQTALGHSTTYLPCDCCADVEDDALSHTLEDTSIAYRLYLECGRMINLYDLHTAFSTVLQQRPRGDATDGGKTRKSSAKGTKSRSKGKSKSKSRQEPASDGDTDETAIEPRPDATQIQARFVQAIAELQLLGFVRPTGRKTDHVVRLTWGAV